MRAVAKYGALTTLGSLVLSALVAAPADGADTAVTRTAAASAATAGNRGVAGAARRAAAAGIAFGPCPKAEQLPAPVTCGTVQVPLDYAAPGDRKIRLTVSRVRASGKPAHRQGALVFNPGGPGASSMYLPRAAGLPAW
jgi:hypothetical protein